MPNKRISSLLVQVNWIFSTFVDGFRFMVGLTVERRTVDYFLKSQRFACNDVFLQKIQKSTTHNNICCWQPREHPWDQTNLFLRIGTNLRKSKVKRYDNDATMDREHLTNAGCFKIRCMQAGV